MAYLFEDIVDDNMLNQDDELFQDDSTSRVISRDDDSDSPDDYQYKIFFNMSQIAKDKTLGWYISHLSDFQDIFLNILKNYRIFENVQESRPKFIIGSSSGNENYTNSYSVDNNFSISHLTQEKINDVTILWEPKYHNGNIEKALQGRNAKDYRSNNDIAFFIGFDADMSNYRNFFEVIIDLCKTFIASVKRVYKSQAAPSTFVYAQSSSTAKMGRVGMKCNPENELPKITNQDKYIQSRMPNWFMAFNPDVKKKEAVKMYNEYLENGVEDKMPDKVVEVLNRMWINRNNCNVEYDDDNIYVKFKPKNGTVSYTVPWGFGKYKKYDYLFGRHMHISGVDELRYDLDYRNYIYEYHNKNSVKDLNNLDFIIDYLFDNNLKKLVIDVAKLSYKDAKQMDGKTIDLTARYPKFKIRIVAREQDRIHPIYAWAKAQVEHKVSINFIDSKGSHKIDYVFYEED